MVICHLPAKEAAMLYDRYEKDQLLFNMNFKEAVGDKAAYRGELVVVEGEIGDAQGRRNAPKAVLKQGVSLAAGDKLVFLSGSLDQLDLLEPLLAKYGPDFTEGTKAILFVVNVAKPVLFDFNGATVELIPLQDGMTWNELADLIGYEKEDFKGQTASQKVVTLVDGLASRKPKLDKLTLAEVMGLATDAKREARGAV
ncbi:MAG: hypothetical protein JSR83_23395 [Proteobacteria bacterium]|nr:hypothetical protein [Pseudomonadota bacterium]